MSLTLLSATQPTTAPSDLTVMSFNIRFGTASDGDNAWPKRREMLFRVIERNNPDLLGTQEAMLFQVDELRAKFPGYEAVAVGREDGKQKGESTGLFFRKDRFELVESGHFWLSKTPEVPGSVSWDTALTRMATWVKLRDRANAGREFIFLNTHYDHRGHEARIESSRLIRAKLKQLVGDKIPFVLTADMNAADDSAEFVTLLGGEWIDAYRTAHPQREPNEASFHGFKGTIEGGRIDYVVHSKQFKCVEATIDRSSEGGRYPSDHFAVVCRLIGE